MGFRKIDLPLTAAVILVPTRRAQKTTDVYTLHGILYNIYTDSIIIIINGQAAGAGAATILLYI